MTPLTVTRHGRVAVLTLEHPENGNRLDRDMADAVTVALQAARTDAAIGACVVTGFGEIFCLGGDYQGAGPTAAGRAEYADALIGMDRALAHLGKPLVCAVNGDAHAGGLSVVIGCDLAVASADATFGLPEAANGLFPFLALAIVKDALPKKALFDLIYNARLLTAQEALDLRIVNEVAPRRRPRARNRARRAGRSSQRGNRHARPRPLLRHARLGTDGRTRSSAGCTACRARGEGSNAEREVDLR